jgi:hypothetical protein
MEVTNEQLINTALNIVGYMAAGVFWIMLYKTFSRAKQKTATNTVANEKNVSEKTTKTPGATDRSDKLKSTNQKLEFIKLGGTASKKPEITAVDTAPKSVPAAKNRNRAEVIRLAREMLSSQTPVDKIKQTLPISEGELAMIRDH